MFHDQCKGVGIKHKEIQDSIEKLEEVNCLFDVITGVNR